MTSVAIWWIVQPRYIESLFVRDLQHVCHIDRNCKKLLTHVTFLYT